MADVDDELLALAGSDDESGDEGRAGSLSPKPARRNSSRDSGERGGSKGRGRRNGSVSEDGEEEGEASSRASSPSSLKSAPMEESDSEAEPTQAISADDLEEKYPVEGLYISTAEKHEISRMREVERETILAERREENQRFKQNTLLRKLVSAAEEKEKEQRRKRSAEDADLDDRKPSRQRARVDGTSSGLDTLRRARAEKSDRQRRREEGRDRESEEISPRKSRDRDAYGGYDDEGDRDDHRRSPKETRAVEPRLVDFERLRISRSNFAEVCFKPGFEDTLTDCYVRVLGKPQGGRQCYYMVCIKGFVTGKAYAMPDASGRKQVVTDQHILVGIGSKTEQYPFIAMSNGKFTEDELEGYKKTLQERGLALPRASALDRKLEDLRRLVSYELTNDEITAMVDRKNFLRRKYDPETRERLQRSIAEAKESKNFVFAAQLQEELDALGKASGLAFRTSLTPQKQASQSPGVGQQERLAQLNAENRRRNNEAVRKAQLHERQRAREIEQKLARGEAVEDDPSKRVRTRAKFLHDHDENLAKSSKPGSGASTPAANGTPRAGAQKVVVTVPEIARLQEQKYAENKGVPTIHKPLLDDDIIASLDLDIDIDID
ncbi:related to Pol II transcription elongation factor [Cephalotrichum gorgonifer]|uniref:Related to Pol II transcription elongation factor n=1 Tax=Cephalotrichum gorgonifer TaxID=2041049 RepID=A0AAE8MS06_9PEZI|nr:related to Pol II transcription elongation factor [Cephalotrichum gorgonifer]